MSGAFSFGLAGWPQIRHIAVTEATRLALPQAGPMGRERKMTKSFDDYIARAANLLEEGFSTKQAQKDAAEYVGRAFDFARENFRVARQYERGDRAWNEMPDAWRALDMPYSPANWNAKRAAQFTAYPGAVNMANICAELRSKIMAAPVVKKEPQKTAAQIAEDAKRRTCQICGRPIFAETGVIAHHGYERPGDGYQTASCPGARKLPFESSRDDLIHHIDGQKAERQRLIAIKGKIAAEEAPVIVSYEVERLIDGKPIYRRGERVMQMVNLSVTRGNFDALKRLHSKAPGLAVTFDYLLSSAVKTLETKISNKLEYIRHQEARAAEWKQAERWNGQTKEWVAA